MTDFDLPPEAITAALEDFRSRTVADDPLEKRLEAAIQAFLIAMDAQIEKRGQMFPAKREGIMEHRDTEHRLVFPWLPVNQEPGT